MSVLDGSYKYCDDKLCPYLSELKHNGSAREVMIDKSSFDPKTVGKRISFCFDRSCNLACPSCRTKKISSTNDEMKVIHDRLSRIKSSFGKNIVSMSFSGTCDPFYSTVYREFLENLDLSDFPNLIDIYIQTNGLLLNESQWMRMPVANRLISTIAVSIDAASERTYKILRKGGNWNVLMKNLKFICNLSCFKSFSFVVQDVNYKEMRDFYDMIKMMCNDNNFNVYFAKINNWGTFAEEDFLQKAVYDKYHPMFEDFLVELRKIAGLYNVTTNINDVMVEYNINKTAMRLI
jgi:MoaA/NifB/PqqE/SkfB family radical SAM enzyme